MEPIRVFKYDPDLLVGLEPRQAELIREEALAPSVRLETGAWEAIRDSEPARAGFGLLVVEGLVSRCVHVERRSSMELLGPGDLLQPWVELEDIAVPCKVEWSVEAPGRAAVLDAEFAERTAERWPSVSGALMTRLVLRSRWLALELAIATLTGVDSRLVMALWHLADRWGRVTSDGVLLPLPLKHETLAAVIGASRPSVSTALGALAERGLVERTKRGWLLHGPPPRDLPAFDREAKVKPET